MKNILKIRFFFLIPIVFFVFSGCTKLIFQKAYNNLDWLAVNEVDEYFDINDAQEKYLEEEFAKILAWHRANEIDVYKKLIESVQADIMKDRLEKKDIKKYFDEVALMKERYVDKTAPVIVNFLAGLEDRQLDYLREELDDYNEERDENLTQNDVEYFEKRVERGKDRMKDLLGDVSPAQVSLLEKYGNNSLSYAKLRSIQRKDYQQKFISFLRGKPGKEKINEVVIGWLRDPTKIQSPEMIEANRQKMEKNIELNYRLHATLSEKQKKHLIKELDKYLEYLVELR